MPLRRPKGKKRLRMEVEIWTRIKNQRWSRCSHRYSHSRWAFSQRLGLSKTLNEAERATIEACPRPRRALRDQLETEILESTKWMFKQLKAVRLRRSFREAKMLWQHKPILVSRIFTDPSTTWTCWTCAFKEMSRRAQISAPRILISVWSRTPRKGIKVTRATRKSAKKAAWSADRRTHPCWVTWARMPPREDKMARSAHSRAILLYLVKWATWTLSTPSRATNRRSPTPARSSRSPKWRSTQVQAQTWAKATSQSKLSNQLSNTSCSLCRPRPISVIRSP